MQLKHWSARLATIPFNPGPSALVIALLATLVPATAGCEEKKPTRMEIRPQGRIEFNDRAIHKKIHLAFFTADGKPYVRKPKAVFDAEDPSVVTVTAEKDGATATLVAKRTGTTKVTIQAFNLSGSIDVTSEIIGSVEFLPGLRHLLGQVAERTLRAGWRGHDKQRASQWKCCCTHAPTLALPKTHASTIGSSGPNFHPFASFLRLIAARRVPMCAAHGSCRLITKPEIGGAVLT